MTARVTSLSFDKIELPEDILATLEQPNDLTVEQVEYVENELTKLLTSLRNAQKVLNTELANLKSQCQEKSVINVPKVDFTVPQTNRIEKVNSKMEKNHKKRKYIEPCEDKLSALSPANFWAEVAQNYETVTLDNLAFLKPSPLNFKAHRKGMNNAILDSLYEHNLNDLCPAEQPCLLERLSFDLIKVGLLDSPPEKCYYGEEEIMQIRDKLKRQNRINNQTKEKLRRLAVEEYKTKFYEQNLQRESAIISTVLKGIDY